MSAKEFRHVDVTTLRPCDINPRIIVPDQAFAELSASIKAKGIIEPLVVREIEGDLFEILAGHRRFEAGKAAGVQVFPVLIRECSDLERCEIILAENSHREDLNPRMEGFLYRQLLEGGHHTMDSLGALVGKSRATVYDRLGWIDDCPEMLEAFASGRLPKAVAANLRAAAAVLGDPKDYGYDKKEHQATVVEWFSSKSKWSAREVKAELETRTKELKKARKASDKSAGEREAKRLADARQEDEEHRKEVEERNRQRDMALADIVKSFNQLISAKQMACLVLLVGESDDPIGDLLTKVGGWGWQERVFGQNGLTFAQLVQEAQS